MIRIFRVYVPRTLVWLAIVELLLMVAAVYLGVELRFWHGDAASRAELDPLLIKAVIFAAVMFLSMLAMGMYWHGMRDGSMLVVLLRIALSFIIGSIAMVLFFYAFPDLFMGRGAYGFAVGLALLALILTRMLYYHYADQDGLKKRVLVFGAGKKAARVEKDLRRQVDRHGVKIIGYINAQGEKAEVPPEKLLNGERGLSNLVREQGIDEIVVAVDDRRKSFPVDDILECKMNGVAVVDLVTLYERQQGKIKIDNLHPSSMIFADGFCQAILRSYSKRLFDISASLLLLLIIWPVMLVTALSIFIESGWRGPILYRQERVGRNSVVFNVLKFRSMSVNAEQDGKAQWASKNDMRVTRVGKVIRKYRIDELPQLLNVLKGEMSFVGPRPERPAFVERLAKEIPFYNLRHKVNPGITGWAQISYPYGASDKDALEKLQYDLYYMKNYSMLLDLVILFQTAHAVFWGKGAR